jgi:hypothetical protein
MGGEGRGRNRVIGNTTPLLTLVPIWLKYNSLTSEIGKYRVTCEVSIDVAIGDTERVVVTVSCDWS